MQITIKGELTIKEIRQALYEKLHELEETFALEHSQGATLYVNPTNGQGDPVILKSKEGRVVSKLTTHGPYKSIADDFKI
jgi:hypothetical protein